MLKNYIQNTLAFLTLDTSIKIVFSILLLVLQIILT